MNHALVIARRELRDRSRLFFLAIGLAVIPFAASLMPGLSGHRGDIIAIAGAILGLALGLGTAIALGNATIAGELAERRLSFYFAKPISPAALWTGKAGAAITTSLATFFIITLPALLAASGTWKASVMRAPVILIGGAIGIVAMFFVSHAAATMVRSRSGLVAIDVLMLAAAGGTMYAILRAVAFAGALRHARVMLIASLVAVLLVLMVVPVRQLANGRTELRRSHASFSLSMWPAVAIIVAGTGAYAAWLITPDATDIDTVQLLTPAAHGDWLLVGGEMNSRPDYYATFAVNRSTGESVRMPSPLWWGASFSRDGRTLAWMKPDGLFRYGPFHLYTRRLDVPDAVNRNTGILVTTDDFVISDDGSRVAVLDRGLLAIYDLASGKLVASASGINGRNRHSLYFVTNDLVRLYARSGDTGTVTISELDVPTRKFAKTGEITGTTATMYSASADGTRALIRADAISDGRTGATIAMLPAWSAQQVRPRMLHDGRVARTGLVGNAIHLQIFDAAATQRHDVVLAGVRNALISGSTVDGEVIVVGSREVGKERTTFVVDLERGTVDRVLENVRGPWATWSLDPRRAPYRGELVATDDAGKLIAYKHDGRAEARPLLK